MSARLTFLLFLVGGGLGMLLHREQQRGTFDAFDSGHRAFLRANPGEGQTRAMSAEPRLLFARLDDPDIPLAQRAFDAWPPAAEEWHVLFQNLRDWTPKAVAVQLPLLFDNPSAGFAEAAAAVPGLILTAPATAEHARTRTDPLPLPAALPALLTIGDISAVGTFDTLTAPQLPGWLGLEEVDLGQHLTVEGDWCRVPLVARNGSRLVPTLPLQALLIWSGVTADTVTAEPGVAITGPHGLNIPLEIDGCFRFYLPLAAPVASVNADTFLFDRAQAEMNYPEGTPEREFLEKAAGALVWIGSDDSASRRLKLPDGNTASAADLFTRALATIQTRRFILPLPQLWQGLTIASTLLFTLWVIHWRRRRLWIGLALGALALLVTSLLWFQTNHTWVPIAPSLILLTAGTLLCRLIPRPGEPREDDDEKPADRKTRTVSR